MFTTVANRLYGSTNVRGHVCVLPGLMLAVMPILVGEEQVQTAPSKDDVEAFFKPSMFHQIEMNFNGNEGAENEERSDA